MRDHLAIILRTVPLLLFPMLSMGAPLGDPGVVATYELLADPEARPAYERTRGLTVVSARIMIGPISSEPAGEEGYQWYGLEWERLNGEINQFWLLLDSWPGESHNPQVAHYLWQEPGWDTPSAFLHESTGEPLLPRNDLWTYGWPQDPQTGAGDSRAPVKGTPERILLQGWEFALVERRDAHQVTPPSTWETLKLNPDLLVGWISMDRDEHGRPFYRLPASLNNRYEYVHKTPDDLRAHSEAGCNFLVDHPGSNELPGWARRDAVFHSNHGSKFRDWPSDLYRPNYWGSNNHIDEPGVHNWGLRERTGQDVSLPEVQAVESLQRIVRRQSDERGGERINERIGGRFGLGELRLRERNHVSWEYEWATAWYQLAVKDGVGGILDEDATSGELVESYNMAFETQIPPTVENACAIRVAVLRGAARNFDKRWGVAFYHPNEVKLKSASIPYFYGKGASYIWFWTGWVGITDNSGLPYSYQRYYASLARQAIAREPNRDMDALLHAAKVAVAIPNGYTFSPHHMHRHPWLHLERENEHGVTYRRVLANAASEVERLLRMGIDFDIVVDEPLFRKTGYDEIIHAQADGRIRIETVGQGEELLDAPRPFSRPGLGPGPTLSIEIEEGADFDDGDITLRAVGRLGTGDWAAEAPHARVSWEIYHPDGTVSPAIFPEYGSVRTLKVTNPIAGEIQHPVPQRLLQGETPDKLPDGAYLVRAALADIFGRPAVAYRLIILDGGGE